MSFRLLAALCLALAAAASGADAQAFSTIAGACGTDPNSPTYSEASYASAFAEAAAARAAAAKAKNTSEVGKIDLQVRRLKQCQAEEKSKYYVPPYRNCRGFVRDSQNFSGWVAAARAGGYEIPAQTEIARQRLKAQAEQCLRQLTSKCIDPTDTKAVLDAVEALEEAAGYVSVYTRKKQSGLERKLTEANPFFLVMRFCTDTDYACTGDPVLCTRRVARIKNAFEAYIER
jgi:hypothetical protein